MKKASPVILLISLSVGVSVWLTTHSQIPQTSDGLSKAAPVEQVRAIVDKEQAAEHTSNIRSTGVDAAFKKIDFIDRKNGWGITLHGLWKTLDGAQSWTLQKQAYPNPVLQMPRQAIIKDVQFISGTVGWLLEDDYLLRTQDGGKSWQKKAFKDTDINSFIFIDDKSGWCVAQRQITPATPDGEERFQGLIYATDDGGDTWELQFAGKPGDLYSSRFEGVFAISTRTVWVVGYDLLHTKDGGKTWKQVWVDKRDELYGRNNRIEFADENTGWITANQGGLYLLTNDGGRSWELRSGPHSEGFYDLIYISSSEAYLVGGGIYKSSDGGKSWNKIIEGDNSSYMDVNHLKTNNLLTAGGSKFVIYPLN
ncbi:MAG: hypothetical protein LC802_22045 [Acidobacteria bacterium]|nr:hypothetical protein [Acidobacteriota bacterium]